MNNMSDSNHNIKNNYEDDSRPNTPSDDSCCGNSCNPCIFDVHKKMLEQWNQRKIDGVKAKPDTNILNPVLYQSFQVAELEEIAEEFIKIRLVYGKRTNNDSSLFLKPGQHVILSMNNKSKPYTPIFWSKNSIELLIRIYPNGPFSQDLKRIKIGGDIQIRGPYGEFEYKRNSFRQIIAFCIGSGIAAIYPIMRSIVDDEIEETRIHLIAGFRTVAQIPLREELRQLSDYWNVECTLQISTPRNDEVCISGMEIRRNRLTENSVNQFLQIHSPEDTLILICGTREFNDSLESWIKNRRYLHYHVFS